MVEIVDGTANGIYSAVKQVFSELHIPMQNIMGYSSYTTIVMFGEHNSVSQMLRAEYPNVYSVKCSCNLIHLASSYAAKMLPKHLEDLCPDIFNHFHRSSKRQDAYRELQEFFNVEPRQLLARANPLVVPRSMREPYRRAVLGVTALLRSHCK